MEQYYIIVNGQQLGPMSIEEMRNRGVNANTVVWKAGMTDWAKVSTMPDLMQQLQLYPQQPAQPQYPQQPVQPQYPQQNPYQQPAQPQYPQQNPYQQPAQPQYPQQNPYQQNPGYEAPHTNWMPWAIVGTILGLCGLGMVFGIIAIVKANNANKLYAQGATMEADSANSSAKTFTIVSLACAAVGLVGGFILGLAGGI